MKSTRLRVIGIQGAMGAGKSTVRMHLVKEYGAKWLPMAGPLKGGLMGMGATQDEIYGSKKAEPNELWGGKTNRFAQQAIGTEWGRNTISQDIWVNCVHRQIMDAMRDGIKGQEPLLIVIDDIRFPNEAAMVEEFGGELWMIRRAESEYAPWKQKLIKFVGWKISRKLGWMIGIHESECWWPMARADLDIDNEGTVKNLEDMVSIKMDSHSQSVPSGLS